jgi:hypothetical protein
MTTPRQGLNRATKYRNVKHATVPEYIMVEYLKRNGPLLLLSLNRTWFIMTVFKEFMTSVV